jgi:hypothetical protein
LCERQSARTIGRRELSKQSDEAFQPNHVGEFKMTGRGTRKAWIVVGLAAVPNDEQLKGRLERAVKFVGELPAKE